MATAARTGAAIPIIYDRALRPPMAPTTHTDRTWPIGKTTPTATQEETMPSATELGTAGLQGWRAKVGNAVAEPL